MTKQCFINEAKNVCKGFAVLLLGDREHGVCKLGKSERDRQWQYDDKQFPLKLHYEMDVMYHDGAYDVAYRR